MKRISIIYIFICTTLLINAQIPAGYYNNAENLNGYVLKTALHNIISEGHTDRGYSALWSFYISNETDIYYENDGTILDMYSENPEGPDPYNFTPGSDQCGTYGSEGDCYNREHSFPKSWFGDQSPMNNDVHHIFPTDGKVNGFRSSYPYGIVGNATTTSQNGSKVGSAESGLGYSGTVFEPIDEFKGDLARAHFYMATRYENVIKSWSSSVLDGTDSTVFEDWALDLLYTWHKNDPVSQKEIDRNNAAYLYQNNRNPFVDHPEYVDSIWFPKGGTTPPPVDPPIENMCIKSFFPASDDNPIWYEVEFSSTDTTNYNAHKFQVYRLIGDTTILDKSYSKLMLYDNPSDHVSLAQYIGALRSDTCSSVYFFPKNKSEFLLYDFSGNVGDTVFTDFLKYELNISYYKVIAADSVEVADLGYRKRMVVETQEGLVATWIEGVGSLKGLLWPVLPNSYSTSTIHPTTYNSGRLLVCQNQFNKSAYKYWDADCFYENTNSIAFSIANDIKIYPQPANDFLTIELRNLSGLNVKIYNQLGQVVTSISNTSGVVNYNISSWPEGIYFVKISDNTRRFLFTKHILVN